LTQFCACNSTIETLSRKIISPKRKDFPYSFWPKPTVLLATLCAVGTKYSMSRFLDYATVTPFLIGVLVALSIAVVIYQFRIFKLRLDFQRQIKEATKRSVEQSRSTLKGQIAEQMAPVLPGFSYLPADARFLGDPIDYVVFNGRTSLANNGTGEQEIEIVLLEVKYGQSKLTPVQRTIAKAVEEGRVRFEVAQIGEDGIVAVKAPTLGRQKDVDL
jgi:predicted Holliday junction resolvase-like endonuclease